MCQKVRHSVEKNKEQVGDRYWEINFFVFFYRKVREDQIAV